MIRPVNQTFSCGSRRCSNRRHSALYSLDPVCDWTRIAAELGVHRQSSMTKGPPDLTMLFARLRSGDGEALGGIMNALYSELHSLAARRMRAETRRHTLQPTALVNEAYLRLMRGPSVINDRHHFFALAAQAMRRVLVDHARQKRAGKRGGGHDQVTLELAPGLDPIDIDVVALDEALA